MGNELSGMQPVKIRSHVRMYSKSNWRFTIDTFDFEHSISVRFRADQFLFYLNIECPDYCVQRCPEVRFETVFDRKYLQIVILTVFASSRRYEKQFLRQKYIVS